MRLTNLAIDKENNISSNIYKIFLASSALLLALAPQYSFSADLAPDLVEDLVAEECAAFGCPPKMRGKMLDHSPVGKLPINPNLEKETWADQSPVPFLISVDGQVVDESGAITENRLIEKGGSSLGNGVIGQAGIDLPVFKQRKTDVELSAVDIQLKFDGFEQKPLLNVSTVPLRRAYRAGEIVSFLTTSNYGAYISNAEVRIFYGTSEGLPREPIAILPTRLTGVADWVVPANGPSDFLYVLRVYDDKGRFDETIPLTLVRSEMEDGLHNSEAIAPGMAEDRTAFRNIPISGGAVTVSGRHVPEGYGITVLNEPIPLDKNGSFVTQQILPPGQHIVDIAVDGPLKGGGLYFTRDVNIPTNEWFYVALADLTVGKRSGDKGIEDVRAGEYDKIYNQGRLAFYLKGKVKGRYLLTAAGDTGDSELKSLFKNLDAKSTREFLKRIDPDKYYPVYGDDSTWTEDAPTKGKFYVRLERGDSHIMWGNYKTHITGTKFLPSSRGLYGANLVVRSDTQTTYGERKSELTAYAALPDTIPHTDEFLGTGGSAYFLRRQDIINGSETLMVEVRDPISNAILDRKYLVHGEDYTFDHVQGVVILKRPLSSKALGGGVVRNGTFGDHAQYLVVSYDYVAKTGDIDDYAYGGRAQSWINNKIRVGVTGQSEQIEAEKSKAFGADIVVRQSQTTYLEAEIAKTTGKKSTVTRSVDGGLTITEAQKGDGRDATGWRVGGQLDLSDVKRFGLHAGKVGGYYEQKEEGFSALTERLEADRRVWGAHANIPINDSINVGGTIDSLKDDNGQNRRDSEISGSWQFNSQLKATLGVRYTELHSPSALAAGKSGYDGKRTDIGARIDYRINEDYLVYARAQHTLSQVGDINKNDRYGLGGEVKLTEKITGEGEVSYGKSGIGGLLGVNYHPAADDNYYVGYRLDPDRAFDLTRSDTLYGRDMGVMVAGIRKRIDEVTSAYTESNIDLFGRRRSLAQTYGVVYTPSALWKVDAGFEVGKVMDNNIDPTTSLEYSDFDRYAGSAAVGYTDEDLGLSGRLRGEVRVEKSDDRTRDANTYALSSGAVWQHDDNGRLLVNADAVLSQVGEGTYYNGDYIEGSVGYAYRPVESDRINALFRYTFLYDLPALGQIPGTTSGDGSGPMQRSHIVSADANYDLLPWLTIGGKYGARFGEMRMRDEETKTMGTWYSSTAHLAILRTDLHIIKEWDALLEARAFFTPAVKSIDYGFLTALYRHVGNNFKIGAGYNFGRFSDDLRDVTLDDRGPFLNVVGKL